MCINIRGDTMKVKGQIVGYVRKGESGSPEITISIDHADQNLTIPILKEVELDL